MALGYQRIHDLSPLSLKLLNDQLEQLWKKMMGGLNTRDMTAAVASKIDSAVTQGQFTSLISQNAQEIRLAAGSSSGENMVRNGNAAFGGEGWEPTGCALNASRGADGSSFFAVEGAGVVRQAGFSLKAGAQYALSLSYLCPEGMRARVGQGIAEGAEEASSDWAEYRLTFTAQEACEAAIELHFGGEARFTKVMLCEGGAGAWRQNPNEVRNSSIALTDERVAIDTRNFSLRLYDAGGEMATEMSADEQGFSKLYVAENIVLRGKPFYLGEGEHHLWVHPDALMRGERRVFTNNGAEPVSLEGCFPDIQEAVDYIPRWCDGSATVHIYGGGSWQYPSGKLTVSHFFGGGRVTLAPWSARHYTLKRVEILNNSLVVDVQGADINSCGAGDCFHAENSVAMLYECRVNGRHLLEGAGSAGYDAAYGALMLLSACEAHNCGVAAHAHLGGRIAMEYSAGGGNVVGAMATTGGILQQSYSTFGAETLHFENSGGKILTQVSQTQGGSPPAATPMEESAAYIAVATGCMDKAGNRWVTSPDWLRAGPESAAVLWFDAAAMRGALSVRPIVYAGLTLRRRGTGGRAGGIAVSLIELKSAGPGGLYMTGTNRGVIGSWRWGEKKTVPLPTAAIDALIRGQCSGFALTAQEEIVLEGVSEHPPLLEIVYR